MFKDQKEKMLMIGLIFIGFIKFILGYLLLPNFIHKINKIIKQRKLIYEEDTKLLLSKIHN